MPYADPDKQREYQRRWCARRRAAWLEGKRCETCGTNERLHVHHRDPALKLSHSIWSWSNKRRLAELAKCVVLCEVCHQAVHGKGKVIRGRVSQTVIPLGRVA